MAAETAEHQRLAARDDGWLRWGPYLSERAWGTVREDYSADGSAWTFFPHDHARSRAYRWNEDGMGGICDQRQVLCLGFSLWNGVDPILKERMFGLTGDEGNHGEDVKEYWWYDDSTPSHSWMRWRYAYPQVPYPYADLVDENGRRSRHDPEYELLDTGVFDEDRYWDVAVEYAKASPDDICIRFVAENVGPDPAVLHVLPTLWFRNTWSWGRDGRRPRIHGDDGVIHAEHWDIGRMALVGDGTADLLFCENETNQRRLWGVDRGTPYPKDGIGTHVVHGADTVNPELRGTKAARWYQLHVGPGDRAEIRLRFSPDPGDLGAGWQATMAAREAEADAFYAELTPGGVGPDEARVMRQAFAGMLWGKQYYHYDVEMWLDGDPTGPPPPRVRHAGRNSGWRHLNNAEIVSMPDCWEYPWYASWDLAFHCVALAEVDPTFAKEQLILMCREWYMHPNGQIPAYEWNFGDVNPPVHAWAALRVFEIDGGDDYDFLARVMHKLLLNFTWWVNRKDADENNVFEGGFLGLDNISPLDRSGALPVDGVLEQSDGTSWMAMYCADLLQISLTLADHDPSYEDVATKFLEHYALIATAVYQQGLWDEEDGFYYDVLRSGHHRTPMQVRSMVGLIPLFATRSVLVERLEEFPSFVARTRWFLEHKPEFAASIHDRRDHADGSYRLLAIVSPDRLRRLLQYMLSTDEFLADRGLRALSRHHADHPFRIELGGVRFQADYEPGESRTAMFGGNSNWRGPVWFPVNFMIIEVLRRYHRYVGDSFVVEHPVGSGSYLTLDEVADDLSRRLVSTFLDDEHGRRPVFGDYAKMQDDPRWHDRLLFYEYFHGDDGHGLGASHQTGWTGLVASLIRRT